MTNNLSQFTNQYQLSKTLRFELKPVGETANWIKKHNIIGVDGNKLVGKDAQRANDYKHLKKLLDEMHRYFLNQALVLASGSAEQQELEKIIAVIEQQEFDGEYSSILASKNLNVRVGLGKLVERLFNKTVNDWVYQYKEDMPIFWQQDIDNLQQKVEHCENNQQIKRFKNAINKIKNKFIDKKTGMPKQVEFKGDNYKGLFSNTLALQLLEWLVRSEKIKVTSEDLLLAGDKRELSVTELVDIIRNFDGFTSYLSGFNENRANIYDLGDKKSFKTTSVLYRSFE